MKRYLILGILSLSLQGFSQKNTLKMNLSSLLVNNYSISYERALGKHTSILMNGRFMPNASIPYGNKLQELIKDSGIDFSQFNLGNTAYTMEFRYYMGKKAQNGFYLAPYVRKSNFDFALPVTIEIEDPATSTITENKAKFTGNLAALSGGLMFGIQKHLSKVFVIDIWLVGAHAGLTTGKVTANLNPSINTILQAELAKTLEEAKNDSPIPFDYSISQDKVIFTANSIAPGVRLLGFNLGITF